MIKYISDLPNEAFKNKWPRTLCILGSTGSIGSSALEVIRACPDRFIVLALAGGGNIKKLAQQAAEFKPAFLALKDEKDIPHLKKLLPKNFKAEILWGEEAYETLASLGDVDIVLSAQSGAAGLRATVAAARAGKVIALANKESLVIAGKLLRSLCEKHAAVILPVDSEHNAIFQCLAGNNPKDVEKLILTASGGPFHGWEEIHLKKVTPEMALKHPKWVMGAKITIDSATLMNKGLEVIEACHLYGVNLDKVDVVIHPQSIIHSLVQYKDGSHLAQLSIPDMRLAISYCLNWPERPDLGLEPLNLLAKTASTLSFQAPDLENFSCLRLAAESMHLGQGAPAVLNAANEVAVEAFLNKKISFLCIPKLIAATMKRCPHACDPLKLEDLLELDAKARCLALEEADRLSL